MGDRLVVAGLVMGVSENGVPWKKQGNIGLDGEHAGISGGLRRCVLRNVF